MAFDSKVSQQVVTDGLLAVQLLLDGAVMGLFTNDEIPAAYTDINAYTEPPNPLYERQAVAWLGPTVDTPGQAYIQATPTLFPGVVDGGPVLVYRWFLYHAAFDLVLIAVIPENAPQPYVGLDPFRVDAYVTQFFGILPG